MMAYLVARRADGSVHMRIEDLDLAPVSYTHLDVYKRQLYRR